MSQDMVEKQGEELESTSERVWMRPDVDIHENQDEILLIADVPGVDKDSLTIRLEEEQLTIVGERKTSDYGEPLRAEYGQFDFRRVFAVNQDVDGERISASLDGGVLTVRLPKHERVKARTIQVTAG